MQDISNRADIIDVRDIIERVEELRDTDPVEREDEEQQELETLEALLLDLKGNGGDEQWEGDWYPITLIKDSYFTEYAKELAEELTSSEARNNWPFNHIDWRRAASELQVDYSMVEYDGADYWYR